MPRLLALVSSLALFASTVHAAPPPDVEVTTCGQVIPKKTLGYLTADLDCTGFTGRPEGFHEIYRGAAVYLEKKSRLDLRGFTITAGHHGVLCDARECAHGNACTKGPCEIFNGTIVGSATNNGIFGYRPTIHDVTITGVVWGVTALDRLSLRNSTIQGSSAVGVAGKKLTISGTTITDSGYFGVSGWTDRGYGPRITDSTITGNGIGEFCGTNPCADLSSVKFPRLVNTTCGTSMASGADMSWGVCTND